MKKGKSIIFLDNYRFRLPTNSILLNIFYNVFIQQKNNFYYKFSIIPKINKILMKNSINDTIIYPLDLESSKKLLSKKIQFKNYTTFYENSDLIDKKCAVFIEKLKNLNPKFKKVLDYEDISLWDFVQFDTWSYLNKRIELLETVKSLVLKEKPGEMIIFDKNSDLGKVCELIAKKYDIKVIDKTSFFSNLFKKTKKIISPYIYTITKPWGIGKLCLKSKNTTKPNNSKNKIILFGNYLFPTKLLTAWSEKIDLKILNNLEILYIHFTDVTNLKKQNIANLSFKSINEYSNDSMIKKIRAKSEELNNFWKEYKKNNEFKNIFVYDSINIYPLIEDLLDYYFKYNLIELLKYIELSKNAFLIEKPKLNISYDEISRVSKCVNYSAGLNKVPTILIQHGALAKYPLYGNFYADIFALYGENSKKIYENLGVNDKKIKVIGNIRFDELYQKMNNYDREQTLLKLGIDHNKKIILFTSQPVTDEENFVLLQEIFDEFSKLSEDFHLIIKLHPAEDGRLHKNIAKNFKNYSIIQNIDIFEIINASDIVITYWSTTGLEAMVFGKPLIVLNLSGKPDKVDYVKEDAALGVYNKNNLSKSIMKCLDDSEFNKKMIESQKKFIYKEAYKIDGHVAKRLLNIVYGMMKK